MKQPIVLSIMHISIAKKPQPLANQMKSAKLHSTNQHHYERHTTNVSKWRKRRKKIENGKERNMVGGRKENEKKDKK